MITTETDPLAGPLEPSSPRRNPGGRKARGYAGRQRKLSCSCGFGCYATAGALERHGFPRCACGRELELANFRDIAVMYPERAVSELESVSPAMRAELVRELRAAGLDGLAPATVAQARRETALGGAAQKRCAWELGYCPRFTAGRYCHEHDPHEAAERGRREVRKGGRS